MTAVPFYVKAVPAGADLQVCGQAIERSDCIRDPEGPGQPRFLYPSFDSVGFVKTMRRKRLPSTSIASIGYDRASAILEIEFIGGATYQYFGVPEDDYNALMSASSKGTYVNQHLKKAGYPYRRIR